MSVINAVPLLAAAGGDYQISRSVRLRSSASAYFNRTPGSTTNQKTWTWSGWVKRGTLTSAQSMFGGGASSSDFTDLAFTSTDLLYFTVYVGATQVALLISTLVCRDPSAWYHIVVAYDSTQATASNRIKIYLNGVQVTSFGTATYPSLNQNANGINGSTAMNIGRRNYDGTRYFDGYLTEINFIDGQALTPSDFGENDTVTGVWKPKKYAGTYGTNGFYLNFSDNSAATAAAIGNDDSGNGNNWTPNNISVTAGATYDSMLDVPTMWDDGGNGRGNYAVLNPVNKALYQPTISDGNLRVAPTTVQYQNVFATFAPTSGKWYAEVIVNGTPNSANMIGVSSATEQNYLTTNAGLIGATSSGYGYYIYNGNKYTNGSSSAYGNSIASGDVVGIALDLDNGKVFFSKNGTWQASGDPVAGTNAAFTGLTSSLGFFISSSSYSGGATSFDHNFGQRPFTYTPPSGFVALNTQNLPDSTINNGNQYFDVSLYTGNATARSITGVGFQPDFVWTKSRSNTESHRLYDAVRGATKSLYSNLTNAEATEAQSLTAFNSDGFSLGTGTPNSNAVTYAAWQWKKGATQGFDIVTYTGTGANRTVAHSLGVAPKMLIGKNRSNVYNWVVWHANMTSAAYYLNLNTTIAQTLDAGQFNSTAPTSSVFSLGTQPQINGNGDNCVMYLFSEVAGFSKFGSYTGNGSTDGPFLYLGFRPRFVMFKRIDTTSNWLIIDSVRGTYNVNQNRLFPNLSNAEDTSENFDLLSNGFKQREAAGSMNASGGTYIFAAFAENPFKNALAR